MSDCPLEPVHTEAGAVFTEMLGHSVPLRFGDPETEANRARSGAGLVDLAHVGTASLEGPDARRFSNGMFTNNIRNLSVGSGNRSAMCDDRGRVQGLLDVHCTDTERFDIVLEGVTAEWFEERYGLYIVFDDVELNVSDADPRVISLQGPSSESVLRDAGFPVPAEGNLLATDGPIRVAAKDRSGLGGYDIVVPLAQLLDRWNALIAAGAAVIGFEALEILRIRAGRPRWPVDGSKSTLVHELGINEEVCNFNKGCYLGQEVINRIDVKGLIQKRVTRVVLPPAKGSIGDTVHLDGKTVGTISSLTRGTEDSVALVFLRKAAWDAEHVAVETAEGSVDARVHRD
tara:strand:- start:558 stop:1589 length:1032 start_codon:yes stop_codon:yes gene_type:complete